MHILTLGLLGLLTLASGADITLRIPASAGLPNPNSLPASTRATLSTLGRPPYSAPLSTSNTFVFRNVSSGSYLADVHCPTYAFAPLRVDVEEPAVKVWETFRGNDWDNRGEAVGDAGNGFEVRVLGLKNYFMERSKFSVLSILKNPMILLGLFSIAIFMGMPYLVDNMDPEMRAEWEERQKTNPMNGLMGAATGQAGAGNPVGNFDMAAFLAGSQKKDTPPPTPPAASNSNGGGGGGKKGKR